MTLDTRDPENQPVAYLSNLSLEAEAEAIVHRLLPEGWRLRTFEQDVRFGGSAWAASADRQGPMPQLDEDPATYTAHYGANTRTAALLFVAAILADRLEGPVR